ncbi:hypothetical protein QR680_010851 [Steinernema hermaphroditum]|uniref:RING-type domain-containing protein n=1 Tax=Steinernema hermaphroditum TaxID=289476 RepID=A0AA39IQC2_9BILA|nr:hypothetical protein QR680_010851 [Steinernema hermaphroditum]
MLQKLMAKTDSLGHLLCPVCKTPFDEAKVFPTCGHSLCATCEKSVVRTYPAKNTKMLICPICKQTARIDRYEHLPNNVILNEIVRDHRSNRISNEIAVNGLVPISMMDEALEELSVDESAVKESHSNAIRRIGKRQQKVQLGYDNLRAKINLLKNGRQVLKAKTSALSSGQFEIEMDKLRKEKAGILAEMEALERWNERYLADITTD